MEQGYSFIWMAGKTPYFLTPSGKVVELEVLDNIPYLRTGSALCTPKTLKSEVRVPCAPVAAEPAPDPEVSGCEVADDGIGVVEEVAMDDVDLDALGETLDGTSVVRHNLRSTC